MSLSPVIPGRPPGPWKDSRLPLGSLSGHLPHPPPYLASALTPPSLPYTEQAVEEAEDGSKVFALCGLLPKTLPLGPAVWTLW